MRLSTRGLYALEAVLAIALQPDAERMSIRTISATTQISDHYLEQIFTLLKRGKIIKSLRGNQGGYTLAKQPGNLTVGDVLRATEGPLSPVRCTSSADAGCDRAGVCLTRPVWSTLESRINQFVDRISIADLVDSYNQDGYQADISVVSSANVAERRVKR